MTGILIQGAAHIHQVATASSGLVEIKPGLAIWTIVTFLILLVILKKLAWKPLIKLINEREQFIKDQIVEAKDLRQDAEKSLEERNNELEKAREEAVTIISQSKNTAEKIKEDMITKAKEETRELIEKGKQSIARERQIALNEIKTLTVELAINAAGKIVQETLDEKKHKKMVTEYLDSLEKDLSVH